MIQTNNFFTVFTVCKKSTVALVVFLTVGWGVGVAQVIWKKKSLEDSALSNNDTPATLTNQNENALRMRYSFSFGQIALIPDVSFHERYFNVGDIAPIRLKTGNSLTENTMPNVLTHRYLSLGAIYRPANKDAMYIGYSYGQKQARRSGTIDDSEYKTTVLFYDYYHRKEAYVRIGGVYSTTAGYRFASPFVGYYYTGSAFRLRVLPPIYLRAYYDFNSHWGVNGKINNDKTDYRMNNDDFNGQIFSYRGVSYNIGLQYQPYGRLLFNVDIGIRTNRSYVIQPSKSDDVGRVGVDTLHLKNTPYISLYFTLGPRDSPE